jgi:hypothetical protein
MMWIIATILVVGFGALIALNLRAANHVADVKLTLNDKGMLNDKKLDKLERIGNATHVLVNSNMTLVLRLNMELAKQVADLNETPQTRAVADLAEKNYNDHVKQTEKDA